MIIIGGYCGRQVLEVMMMDSVGLIFGSDTGMTEDVTDTIMQMWSASPIEVIEVGEASVADFERFDKLIFGLPTWFDGDLQSDWEAFFEDHFQQIDFTGKTVAIYGLGDQYAYADFFVDGIGILAKTVLANGGKVIGRWPTKGYTYTESKAEVEGNNAMFYGLAIDELNDPEETQERLDRWLQQLAEEFALT